MGVGFATASTVVRLRLGVQLQTGLRSHAADLAEVTEHLRSERMLLEAAREVEAAAAVRH